MIPFEWIQEAAGRIEGHIRHTPLTHDPAHDWYLKWENKQVTGSFKARGALNKTFSLVDWERQRGLVAASAGNHGQGLALAGSLTGAPVDIFVPASAPRVKLKAMQTLGATLHLVDGGYARAETQGKAFAAAEGKTWVSPYNDGQIIAGQGTIGLELMADLPLDERFTVLAPVSGGGLLAGVAAALSTLPARPRLIGVQAAAAPFMHHLFYQGTQADVVEYPTIADGLAGAIEEPSMTLPVIKRLVDDIVLVSEEEIAAAIAFAWRRYQEKIEGAAAVVLAALLSGRVAARPAVGIISGGNLDDLAPYLTEASSL